MISDVDQFCAQYDCAPSLRIEAPGRVNLIGEHIDYLGGCVMPVAIEPKVTLLVAPESDGGKIELWSTEQNDTKYKISPRDFAPRTIPKERWLNYPIGVMSAYAEQGVMTQGCRVGIFSTLPAGAGLSSSAALETAFALLIEELSGQSCSILERALRCQRAEHKWVGVPCGIMDQLSVGAGVKNHALRIDCEDQSIKPVPLPKGLNLVVADSGVKHALADGEYHERRRDCEAALEILHEKSWRNISLESVLKNQEALGDRLFKRARHVVTEMQRVNDFSDALINNQISKMARLMRASHNSLRDDFEVSCYELDVLVDAGFTFGARKGHAGSRMTGAGFGGSTIHLVHESIASNFIEHLGARYHEAFERELNCFLTQSSHGAHIRSLSTLKPAL
ncbi:galactokinase [Akkermansiaceae bacterium]|nr:galactokinase [Akkermansiaceae bacterium]MDB4375460.1 galactokinase [bacterium]MDA7883876.1 galactokinase [Akkermansiaceae bacterium]MDA7898426.1 galactokinase [Akkermansiaceae bacterium]MDA8960533.1 galactokinase [Akkermansiaceae bacterium]